jgi:hypothetical protein
VIKNIFIFFFITTSFSASQTSIDHKFIEDIDTSLSKLVTLQKTASHIHPSLERFYPIAIVRGDTLFVFDYDQLLGKYNFVKSALVPFPMSEAIQASFPLSVYENLPTCVVGKQIFSSLNGYATIMHEFVHCWQLNTDELSLRSELEIAQNAMANQDYSWEITHAFSYDDSSFVYSYDKFLDALQRDALNEAKKIRLEVKNHLSKIDFEYLVWEEWKEGLARFVENKVQKQFGISQNTYGKDMPFNRILFYYSGAMLISKLSEKDTFLTRNSHLLLEKMREF